MPQTSCHPGPLWRVLAGLVLLLPASLYGADGEFLITDFGAKGDNGFDNAPIINSLIAGFGASGGTILVPAGEFRVNSPIVVDRNYVTIRGVNYGQRSNIDSTPSGVFGPSGGSKIIVGAGVASGVAVYSSGPKILGLTIRDIGFQGSDGAVFQHGVFIDRDNQWTRISNINCVNLRKGIFLRQAEEALIEMCWLGEAEAPLHMDGGRDCILSDNEMGGQPAGVTCEVRHHDRLMFSGNEIFGDGYTNLWLNESNNCNVTHNTMYSWYTGLMLVTGNMNLIAHNNISGVVRTDGSWASDPRGRNGDYGLIRIAGNDNSLCDLSILSWQPAGDIRVNVLSGERNAFRNLWIGALTSARKIYNNPATSWTRLTLAGWANEIDTGGSPTVRVTYDP